MPVFARQSQGLLVIFGAGASSDSINTDTVHVGDWSYRPPLAAQLFEDRANFNAALADFPQFRGRVPGLRRKAMAGGLDVERELEQMKNEVKTYEPALAELAAIQFYLRKVLWDCSQMWHREATGATNYAELLSRIDRWRRPRDERVVLVTFNYDILLDLAAETLPVSLNLQDVDGYVAREDYKLVKPHGSVNWGQELDEHPDPGLPDEEIIRLMIEHVDKLRFSNRYVNTGMAVRFDSGDRLAFPAISIPVEQKSVFACPDSHLEVLRRALIDDVRRVLVVGWRASEDHFHDAVLKDRVADRPVLVVGENRQADETTAANLEKAGLQRNRIECSDAAGFTGFLATAELDDFLNRAV
jgi:hypothetical protein